MHLLGGIQFVVGPSRLNDLTLLLQRKVHVFVSWVDVFGVLIQTLVVGDDSRVAKVVHPHQSFLGHGEARG